MAVSFGSMTLLTGLSEFQNNIESQIEDAVFATVPKSQFKIVED
jgi:hypothetical protein